MAAENEQRVERELPVWLLKEDYWAIYLALGLIFIALLFYWGGATIKLAAVAPPGKWTSLMELGKHFAAQWPWYTINFILWLAIFTMSCGIMKVDIIDFVKGFTLLYIMCLIIFVVSSSKFFKDNNLESPLVALAVGLIFGNLGLYPRWMEAAFRVEYYIKTGIILLGATLPFTLIIYSGGIAILQATMVAVTTFLTVYLAATRLFKLEPHFGACLGAGASVCGVSATIAVGGAVRAHKDYMSVGISLVALWALVMIYILPILCRALELHPGVAGAWIGTSEFADAAGFAAAVAIGHEAAIRSFTMMKVIGRDIFIGIWSLMLAIISVVFWEKQEVGAAHVGVGEIWRRFPKFVIGFFLASLIMFVVGLSYGPELYSESIKPMVVSPIKTLRTWTFLFCFLSIGYTTRFKELTQFGWSPLWAFTIGVAINVPLGYFLSAVVFKGYWMRVMEYMY
ncbi:MAG: YeiH family protein [Desulfobacteraceae bacterium]